MAIPIQTTAQPVPPSNKPSPQTTPQPEDYYKPPSKLIFFVFALTVILIAIGIGKIVYNNNKPAILKEGNKEAQEFKELTEQTKELMDQAKMLQNQNPPGTTIAPQGTSIPDSPLNQANTQTQQWQTYQNPTAKFSISYPITLQAQESPAGFGVNSIQFVNKTNSALPPDYHILIFPKLLGNTIGQDFDKYYAMNENTTITINGLDGASQQLTKLKNRTIDGQRAFDFGSLSEVGTYVEIDNSIAIFSTAADKRGSLDAMLTTLQIL